MCRGYFRDNRPTIGALLLSPSFLTPNVVEFIVDTGADGSAITLADALKVGINIPTIVTPDRRMDIEGVGGRTDRYPIEDSIGLVFPDYSLSTSKFSFHIEFLKKIDLIPRLPMSILGREILDRFDIEISRVLGEINLKRNDFGEGGHVCFSL